MPGGTGEVASRGRTEVGESGSAPDPDPIEGKWGSKWGDGGSGAWGLGFRGRGGLSERWWALAQLGLWPAWLAGPNGPGGGSVSFFFFVFICFLFISFLFYFLYNFVL